MGINYARCMALRKGGGGDLLSLDQANHAPQWDDVPVTQRYWKRNSTCVIHPVVYTYFFVRL